MAKILQLKDEAVSIGMDDGTLLEMKVSDLAFSPQVGDEVCVYKNDTSVIVTKTEQKNDTGLIQNTEVNVNVTSSVNTCNKRSVNKVIYLLLAFFLGGAGIHKFYVGKIGMGILYLLFCWTGVPSFIALIEFVIALFKKADSNGCIYF